MSSVSITQKMSVLEKIHQLKPEQSRLLHSGLVGDQRIEIREYENLRWINIGGNSVQGLIDMEAPERILLPNLQAMLAAFLFCEKPSGLLNLGFGGGAFERYFVSKLPELEITSVESSQEVVRLAKEYFCLPDHCDLVNDSAEHYLTQEQGAFDIILCDLFSGEKQPECLNDNNFYADAFRCLKEGGVLVMNLLPLSEKELVEILLPIRNHFEWVLLLETPNHDNIILFALSREPPTISVLDSRAVDLVNVQDIDLTDTPSRLNILPKKKL